MPEPTEQQLRDFYHAVRHTLFDTRVVANPQLATPVELAGHLDRYLGEQTQPGAQRNTEIEMCNVCKGRGVISREELTDYHRRYYDNWYEDCSRCNATGRLSRTTITWAKPYVKPETNVRE